MKPPIKNYIQKKYPAGNVTQWFGENIKLYKEKFGTNGHTGLDIVAPYGTPILAVTDQTIVDVKYTKGGYGRHIRAVDDKYEYTYGHLSEISLNSMIGQTVKAGTEIGKMGNTGFVVSGATPFWKFNPFAGTHLHITLRELSTNKKDPYVDYPTGRIRIKNYYNGFKGAIDPEPLFELDSTVEVKKLRLTVVSLMNQVISLLKQIISLKIK